jgi:hypothetical protein
MAKGAIRRRSTNTTAKGPIRRRSTNTMAKEGIFCHCIS